MRLVELSKDLEFGRELARAAAPIALGFFRSTTSYLKDEKMMGRPLATLTSQWIGCTISYERSWISPGLCWMSGSQCR